MKYYKKKTKNYIVSYPAELKDFVDQAIDSATRKRSYLKKLFNAEQNNNITLKAAFFSKREDFVNYIKKITKNNNLVLEDWVSGCFFNGEIQGLVKPADIKYLEKATLLHETVHLYFTEFVYKKYSINRVAWLDEAYANYLDGRNTDVDTINKCLQSLKNISQNFDVNKLDKSNWITDEYNAYHMFILIGNYIFENHLEKEYLDIIKTDYKKIRIIGKTILAKAYEYYSNKLNIKSA